MVEPFWDEGRGLGQLKLKKSVLSAITLDSTSVMALAMILVTSDTPYHRWLGVSYH